jgi:hypothetical protein
MGRAGPSPALWAAGMKPNSSRDLMKRRPVWEFSRLCSSASGKRSLPSGKVQRVSLSAAESPTSSTT